MSFIKIAAILISIILLSSCYSEKDLREKALHESQAGDRINRAQQNTDHLYNELE
jgi:hypothetical protein